MEIVIHKENGIKLFVVSKRNSYGGIIVCECVSLEIAKKYNFNIQSQLCGLYYEHMLERAPE